MAMRTAVITVLAVLIAVSSHSQERFSFFAPSTPDSVTSMLTLAALRDGDVVIDLGSGDGLIPLTAARMHPGVRGLGVDIDPKLVQQSNERASTEGLAGRVRFEHRNAFDADLSQATVVTMWLFPELMRLLRPVILERARPGTRVLTSTWNLGDWQPDQVAEGDPPIYLWVVPARVAGGWEWDLSVSGRRVPYSVLLEQHFQKVEGVARAGARREVLTAVTLRGADIAFALDITLDSLGRTRHEFTGQVDGDRIAGTVTVTPSNGAAMTLPWRAQRSRRPAYFAPTGTGTLPPDMAK